MKKKWKRMCAAACTAALALLCCVALAACGSNGSSDGYYTGSTDDPLTYTSDTSGGVAATVNGVEIGENVITAYIDNFREGWELSDDEAWAESLIDYYGYSSIEELRSDIIDYYVMLELVRQAAEENDVVIDDDEVAASYQEVRDQYETEEDWQEALIEYATDEALQYWLTELTYLQDATMEAVCGDVTATDEEIIDAISSYVSEGGKRSSHILFDAEDEETAQEVLDQINSGELSFEDAAAQYSTDSSAEDGGDVGWDNLSSFVDEYQEALDELEVGEVSGLVTSDYGIHIIMCTDELDPIEELTSIDQISSEGFLSYVHEILDESAMEDAFDEWMEEYEESCEIVINDMPDGLSYYVDLSAYTDETDEEETEDDTTGTTDADDTTDADSTEATTEEDEEESSE